ncbi:hypothetical protein GWK47_011344 [Chionoecetes opilio]|uniref:Uncharacterized protein n=1 Tax=Chionoecetes opilio TaxID=41210 RepID=A0A8J4XVM7_CHIOP|nr:hypothetical protein GWK47_011344 [Chionoecetes opilio]
MEEYLQQTLSHGTHPRENYRELLVLSYRFLGGQVQGGFRQPGTYHHARWMANAIYALKIFMFRHQLDLTAREEGGLRRLRLFISLAYVKQWNEAMVSNRAPLHDLEFLRLLETYPDKEVSHTASTALKRHLWYLLEDLVGLGFFDDRIPKGREAQVIQRLQSLATKKGPQTVVFRKFQSATTHRVFVTGEPKEVFPAIFPESESPPLLKKIRVRIKIRILPRIPRDCPRT